MVFFFPPYFIAQGFHQNTTAASGTSHADYVSAGGF
jgi:hypothetical protein